ncbi:MAG: C40 family peptidase [Bacteroidota bacterium]
MINLYSIPRYVCFALLLSVGFTACKSAKPRKTAHHRAAPSRAGSYSKPKPKPREAKLATVHAETVIETARSYLGTPYKYGGTTSKGMDCSGLVFTSFQAVNITLPRSSQAQSGVGKPIKTSEIHPGDLLFFSEKKGVNKISHVGLVTSVRSDNEIIFIHSTNSRGVMEDDLFSEHYHKIFIKAVRPF